MNKKNPIGWCDRTLNVLFGCLHGCPFCYARTQAKRRKHDCQLCYEFTPHAHLERLEQLIPTQKPQRIFMDSMSDWNSQGMERDWQEQIIQKMSECKQHTFQILSKRPEGFSQFHFPENVWLGTSALREGEIYRVNRLKEAANGNLRFLSIEPIQERITHHFTQDEIDWMIVGAETGHRKNKVVPEKDWIDSLIANARAENIPIFVKHTISERFGSSYELREFPRSI